MTVRGANIGTGTASGRNIISGNGGDGINAESLTQFSAGQPISGNYIGLGADGVTAIPNGGNGIALTTPFDEPLIQSNLIGRNTLSGLRVTNGFDVAIGGTTATANRIFGNQADGVTIAGTFGRRNTVRANSIDGNGGLGIDLLDDGVTLNDANDTDDGPNDLQNYPDLIRAITSTGVTVVTGTLFSTPATTFSIDFYASPAADPSGHGEGAQYLSTTAVVTDATGHATFTATVAASSAGTAITATATAAETGTSEFSNAVAAEAGGTLQFSGPTYSTPEGGTATITVTRTGGSAGTVTVNYSTADGTATAGQDYTPATGTLTFLDGQTTATFTVSTTADGTPEDGETIQLSLSNATGGAALGSPAAAVLTIAGQADIPTLSELGALIFAALLALIAVKSARSS